MLPPTLDLNKQNHHILCELFGNCFNFVRQNFPFEQYNYLLWKKVMGHNCIEYLKSKGYLVFKQV